MDKSGLIERLKSIVAVYAEDTAALADMNENTDFIKDLKMNSANLVDVVLDIEEEFQIEIDNASMEKMLNVQAALDVIRLKLDEVDRK